MLLNLSQYHRPQTVDEAVGLLAERVRPLAGGTHLVASQDPLLEGVIDLGGLGLKTRELLADGTLRLGAMLRLAELPGLPELETCHDGALLAAARSAWPSLGKRHLATLGGQAWVANQRSLIGALLVALDASLVLAGKGPGEPVPARIFYRTPRPQDQLLTQIILPAAPAASGTVLEAVRSLPSAIPNLGLALHLAIDRGRLTRFRAAIGPGAAQPLLLEGFAESLQGAQVEAFPYHRFRSDLPGDIPVLQDARGSALYRRRVLPVLLERATRRALTLAEAQI